MTITIPSPVLFVLRRLHSAGFPAYLVGGCVRDALMGRVPGDYDVTTAARPDEMLRVLAEKAGRLVTVDGDRALSEIGNDKVMNVLLLGIAAGTGELGFSRDDLLPALETVLPPKVLEINKKALYYRGL